MDGLSASALAGLAGTSAAEVQRLVDFGILVARDGSSPFHASDVQKVRLVEACERAGLPIEGIARMAPDEPVREDELEIVPLLRLAHSMGNLDPVGLARIGRAWAEGLRLAATVENDDDTARFGRLLESGTGRWTAMEQAARLATELLPLVDRALMACYRRRQELVWTEDLVEDIEDELEMAGVLRRRERVPAMCVVDLAGYTRVTEERGDAAAAELAGTLAALVDRVARGAGQVLVSGSVAESTSPEGVAFVEAGEVRLKGFGRPVRLLEAYRA